MRTGSLSAEDGYRMQSGRTSWDELVCKYYVGAETVRWMQEAWESVGELIDDGRLGHVKAMRLLC